MSFPRRSAHRFHLAHRIALGWLIAVCGANPTFAQHPEPRAVILPEQRRFDIRSPEEIRRVDLPLVPAPPTVSDPLPVDAVLPLTLDECIRIALERSDVVRILAGDLAVAAGPTIYDPGINNTQIDAQRGVFDPTLANQTTFGQTDQPFGLLNPAAPPATIIQGSQNQSFNSTTTITKRGLTGATAQVAQNVNRNDLRNGIVQPLNPATTNSTQLSLTQPLLNGAGFAPNTAPIVIARINTERSFFQLKDSVQNLVRSVVESYWNLQYAQIQVWVREQQVSQGKEALDRAEGRFQAGLGNLESDVAQARVSYENFRADLITAQADVWRQEGVLRNLPGDHAGRWSPHHAVHAPVDHAVENRLGRAPFLGRSLSPRLDRTEIDPGGRSAEPDHPPQPSVAATRRGRPLSLERARRAHARRDHVDRKLGRLPRVASRREFFSPARAAHRASRHPADRAVAGPRSRELGSRSAQRHARVGGRLSRPRAKLRPIPGLPQGAAEYAYQNVQQQTAAFQANTRVLYLNVLLAITDWGNAVRNENQALTSYNTLLARMEVRTGTILDSHGVRFAEERYGSIGPKGRLHKPVAYPRSMSPTPNSERAPPAPEDSYKMPEFIGAPRRGRTAGSTTRNAAARQMRRRIGR
ncbi:MAG: TolC family protein [Pirellulales bacterium]